MINMKWILATSLSLMTVVTLSACNQTQERQISVEREGAEGVGQVREDESASLSNQQVADRLEGLQSNQPLDWYTQEFQRMGLQVVDVSTRENNVRYDLRRGDQRFLVTLELDEEQMATQDQAGREVATQRTTDLSNRRVQDVQVDQFTVGRLDEQQGDQQVTALMSQLEQLQTGKQPVEYISDISRHGRVTEYEWSGNTAEIEFEDPSGRQFTVDMNVDENTNRVTSIDVNREFWRI